jgi:glutathione S-transferase
VANVCSCEPEISGGGWKNPMPSVTLFGFPRSVYVQMAGLYLTHKEVRYAFRDLEPDMGTPTHLSLHPFDRVPILQHGDFVLYETSAIASYVDEVFDGPKLTPPDPQQRARMNQWISAINGYYYPYLIYHVSHERNVFPQLGIPSDEKVVAHALPKVEVCLQVMERELSHRKEFLLGPQLTLADFYMLPIIHASGFPGSPGHVSELSLDPRLAGADGSLAYGKALPRRATAAWPDRACA